MIPHYDIALTKDLDLRSLKRAPPEDLLTQRGGLVCNDSYVDPRWITWEDYDLVRDQEKQVLDSIIYTTMNEEEFFLQAQELAEKYEWYGIPADIGLYSLTCAIAALDMVPVHGGQDSNFYDGAPYLAFFAQKEHARILRDVLKQQPVAFRNHGIEGYDGLIMQARTVIDIYAVAGHIEKKLR